MSAETEFGPGDKHDGAAIFLSVITQRPFAHLVGSSRHSFPSRLAAMLGRTEFPRRAELAALRPATRFLMVGLAAWIGLVGLVTVMAIASVEMSTLRVPVWFGARAAEAQSQIRSTDGFENILQRPLFSRSRQGTSVAVLAPPSLPAALDPAFNLKGVFIDGAFAKVFLTSAQNPLGVWVQTNEEIAGWRVVAVKPDQVSLEGQNEKLVIPLSINGSAK